MITGMTSWMHSPVMQLAAAGVPQAAQHATEGPIAPAWAVLPLAFATLVVVAVHWTALAQADMPRWRKSLRTANGLVMMLAIPVLAAGFGIVDPQHTRHFVMTWMLATGLLCLVMLMATVDVLASSIVFWRERRVALRNAAKARALLVEHARQGPNASIS
jgi:hypothetical protein